MWYGFILSLFIFMKGLISNIDAPVVPMIFAMTAPKSKIPALSQGVDFLSTLINIPPEATNKEASNAINERYSAAVCKRLCVSLRKNR